MAVCAARYTAIVLPRHFCLIDGLVDWILSLETIPSAIAVVIRAKLPARFANVQLTPHVAIWRRVVFLRFFMQFRCFVSEIALDIASKIACINGPWRPVYTCDFWCDFWCDFTYKTRLTLPCTNVFFREASRGLERKLSHSHIISRHPSFQFLLNWRYSVAELRDYKPVRGRLWQV